MGNFIIMEIPTEHDFRYGLLVKAFSGKAVPCSLLNMNDMVGLALEHTNTRRMTVKVFVYGAFPSKEEWNGL